MSAPPDTTIVFDNGAIWTEVLPATGSSPATIALVGLALLALGGLLYLAVSDFFGRIKR